MIGNQTGAKMSQAVFAVALFCISFPGELIEPFMTPAAGDSGLQCSLQNMRCYSEPIQLLAEKTKGVSIWGPKSARLTVTPRLIRCCSRPEPGQVGTPQMENKSPHKDPKYLLKLASRMISLGLASWIAHGDIVWNASRTWWARSLSSLPITWKKCETRIRKERIWKVCWQLPDALQGWRIISSMLRTPNHIRELDMFA